KEVRARSGRDPLIPAAPAADRDRVHTPDVRNEGGFGLVELLIAMVVLNIALLAIVAAFSSGAVAVSRAGSVATASALADQQMELYRAMPYEPIGLDTAAAPSSGTYTTDVACISGSPTCSNTGPSTNAG